MQDRSREIVLYPFRFNDLCLEHVTYPHGPAYRNPPGSVYLFIRPPVPSIPLKGPVQDNMKSIIGSCVYLSQVPLGCASPGTQHSRHPFISRMTQLVSVRWPVTA